MTENTNPDTAYDSYDNYDTDVYGTAPDAYGEPMVGPLDAPEQDSGFHQVNIGQLVMGVAFAGIVLVWALVQGDVVETGELRWLLPIPWIAAGAAGLVATVLPSRRTQQ